MKVHVTIPSFSIWWWCCPYFQFCFQQTDLCRWMSLWRRDFEGVQAGHFYPFGPWCGLLSFSVQQCAGFVETIRMPKSVNYSNFFHNIVTRPFFANPGFSSYNYSYVQWLQQFCGQAPFRKTAFEMLVLMSLISLGLCCWRFWHGPQES